LFPAGFEFCQPVIGWLAAIGIVYAGLVALVQDDFKFVIGYSSVAHMGFVLLGIAAGTMSSLAGSVLQMFSHGIVAGLLFAIVGSLVYDRVHTRQLNALSRLPLHRLLPFALVIFILAGAASMGFPGFSGFPAELTILSGTWRSSPWWTACAAFGIVVSAAFTLRALQRAFLGRAESSAAATPASAQDDGRQFSPVTWAEKIGTFLLLGTSLLIGLKPDLLLNWIMPALQSPYFQTVLKGGGR
jgi:NADH-quinone oxidoreductase subunit M